MLRAERIRAMQRLPELERELASLAPIAAERKREQKARWRERQVCTRIVCIAACIARASRLRCTRSHAHRLRARASGRPRSIRASW